MGKRVVDPGPVSTITGPFLWDFHMLQQFNKHFQAGNANSKSIPIFG
jgi:hypothetical protein